MPAKSLAIQSSESIDAGAPAALSRIARAEAEAWQHHAECRAVLELALSAEIECPMNAAEDCQREAKTKVNAARFALDDAEKRVQSWSKLLLSFDVKVTPERRDAEEKITRAEGERCFGMMAITMRTATEDTITATCQEVLGCTTPAQAHRLIADKLRECVCNSVKSAIREAHLPSWAIGAVEAVL